MEGGEGDRPSEHPAEPSKAHTNLVANQAKTVLVRRNGMKLRAAGKRKGITEEKHNGAERMHELSMPTMCETATHGSAP